VNRDENLGKERRREKEGEGVEESTEDPAGVPAGNWR
jgi:hypothetical protein